jgi:hypothetical protein
MGLHDSQRPHALREDIRSQREGNSNLRGVSGGVARGPSGRISDEGCRVSQSGLPVARFASRFAVAGRHAANCDLSIIAILDEQRAFRTNDVELRNFASMQQLVERLKARSARGGGGTARARSGRSAGHRLPVVLHPEPRSLPAVGSLCSAGSLGVGMPRRRIGFQPGLLGVCLRPAIGEDLGGEWAGAARPPVDRRYVHQVHPSA